MPRLFCASLPPTASSLWALVQGNVLPDGWLLQSPGAECWGNPNIESDCAQSNAPGTRDLAHRIRDVIASANEWVDITTLPSKTDMATGIFQDNIVQGLVALFKKTPNATIRILGGRCPGLCNGVASDYLGKLMHQISLVDAKAAQNLRIFVAAIEPMHAVSWNHAKIVAADGVNAIVGGHNLYGPEAYDNDHPITDVSMHVQGPAAAMSHSMANSLWTYACAAKTALPVPNMLVHAEFARSTGTARSPCPQSYSPPKVPAGGSVSILAVGGLGRNMASLDNDTSVFVSPRPAKGAACPQNDTFNYGARYALDNPDWAAILAVLNAASIFLSQQDILRVCLASTGISPAKWSVRLIDVIAQKLWQGVSVTIVVSTPMDEGNTRGYSVMRKLVDIPHVVLPRMCLSQAADCPARARRKLCAFLKLASVRVAHDMPTWKSGFATALQSKVFLVDDAVFFVASRNLYPAPLQEFGFIVEDAIAAQHLKAAYLDPLWEFSSDSAIVDADTGKCEIA